MKRFLLGVGILLGLVAAGILTTRVINRIQQPVGAFLEQAAEASDWDRAESFSRQARDRWDRYRDLSAAVTDHTPMEQIDALFGQLEIYTQYRDWVRFRACCAELKAWTDAVAEAQSIRWWSIF